MPRLDIRRVRDRMLPQQPAVQPVSIARELELQFSAISDLVHVSLFDVRAYAGNISIEFVP